jgi:lantibiotic biosynthesis protein
VNSQNPAAALAEAIADRLADPGRALAGGSVRPWLRQSLAYGAPGIALLHVERAAAGLSPWQRAHDWLAYLTSAPVTTGPNSHLFHGAPALAHVLSCAAACRPGSYSRALSAIDRAVSADARHRIRRAYARIDSGMLPDLAEFDVIRGLAGLGSYLLRRSPDGAALHDVLGYLVRLTEPLPAAGTGTLPGWWTTTGPSGRHDSRFAGGHANLGMAHGIGGPLAVLSLAARSGITVDGQFAAITRICAWLDRWRDATGTGLSWPYWVSRAELDSGQQKPSSPQRLGWCYGSIGLARAQQLAALATGDQRRQHEAEHALIQALADTAQRALTTSPSICHGTAGIAQVATAAAADAAPGTAARLQNLAAGLLADIAAGDPESAASWLLSSPGRDPGFLDGAAGIALAALSPGSTTTSRTGWDACLLIS